MTDEPRGSRVPVRTEAPGTLVPRLPDHVARNALDHVADMIVITDAEGTILYVNPAFTEITGYPAEEALGGNPRLLRSGIQDDDFYADLWETLLAGRVWHGEIVNRRRDGTLYPDEMRITPVLDDGEPVYFVAVKRDVSRLLGAMTTGAPTAVAHVHEDGRLLYANERFEELFAAPFEELAGEGWHRRLRPTDERRLRELVSAAARTPDVSCRLLSPDGRHLRARCSPLRGRDEQRLGSVLVLEDVTEEVEHATQALEREGLVRTVLDGLPDPTVLIGPDHRLVHANAAWWAQASTLPGASTGGDGGPVVDEQLVGLVVEAVSGGAAPAVERVSEPGVERVSEPGVERVSEPGVERVSEAEGARGRWWLVRVRSIGRDRGALLTWTDITDRKREELRQAHRADHDALTGLLNRSGALHALRRSLAAGPLALLFLDLDGFKEVNDELGHPAGDELLRAVARRLDRAGRATDTVGRLGGDEFVVVAPGVTTTTVAETIADRLRACVERPIRVDGAIVTAGASVGWTIASQGADPDEVLARADRAMYDHKRARGGARPVVRPTT